MFKFIVVAVVCIIIFAVLGSTKEKYETKQAIDEEHAERARRALEAQDWRKVGVVESYRNRGMLGVTFHSICPLCGHTQPYGEGSTPVACPTRFKRFEQDKRDGIFPSGISPDNVFYLGEHYCAFRLIELELREGDISKAEACEKRAALVEEVNQGHNAIMQVRQRERQPPDTSYRNDYLT